MILPRACFRWERPPSANARSARKVAMIDLQSGDCGDAPERPARDPRRFLDQPPAGVEICLGEGPQLTEKRSAGAPVSNVTQPK